MKVCSSCGVEYPDTEFACKSCHILLDPVGNAPVSESSYVLHGLFSDMRVKPSSETEFVEQTSSGVTVTFTKTRWIATLLASMIGLGLVDASALAVWMRSHMATFLVLFGFLTLFEVILVHRFIWALSRR